MRDICGNPMPTHADQALIPAQGRDPNDVQVDIQRARAATEAIRNERTAALGPDPDCPVPIP